MKDLELSCSENGNRSPRITLESTRDIRDF
jgi:hypothetical protein